MFRAAIGVPPRQTPPHQRMIPIKRTRSQLRNLLCSSCTTTLAFRSSFSITRPSSYELCNLFSGTAMRMLTYRDGGRSQPGMRSAS